jgi:hypothetical protein
MDPATTQQVAPQDNLKVATRPSQLPDKNNVFRGIRAACEGQPITVEGDASCCASELTSWSRAYARVQVVTNLYAEFYARLVDV